MNFKLSKKTFRFIGVPGFLAFAVLLATNAVGAPGTLSNNPLYLGAGAKPNVLWVVDDSGSMDWEVLKRKSAEAVYQELSNRYENEDNVTIPPVTKEDYLESCAGYNALAYNPNVTYKPWFNADGTAKPVHTGPLTSVPDNPINVSGSDDLSGAKYMVWNDADNDGDFDAGECGENAGAQASESVNPLAIGATPVDVSTLSPAEQQNYTTWYTYYRKRTYVMKAILTHVFAVATDRFGLATLKNNAASGVQIGDMTVASHKISMINKIIDVPAASSTHLKRALRNAGRYYHQNDGTLPESDFVNSSSPANPIQHSCQANYTIMVTDGYANESTSVSVGNADGTAGGPFADSLSNTIADVAMYYYDTDLVTAFPDDFKSNNPLDTNRRQHMVTFAVAFGVEGSINPDPIPDANGVLQPVPIANNWTAASNGWPTSIPNNTAASIDDLYHATFNSRGQFFNSSDPEEMQSDIQAILDAIADDTEGTAAAVGVNSTSISANTVLFQAWFSSAEWTGELRAYDFANNAAGTLQWEAGDVLDARDLSVSPRMLLTYSSTEDLDGDVNTAGAGKGILFDTPADISNIDTTSGELNSQHLTDLMSNSYVSAATAANKQAAVNNLINWFKGDKTNESALFRARDSLLGDIVSSSPQYVGAPNERYPNHIENSSSPYLGFVTAKANRTPMVYVGSNDGMLHGFRASNGEEIFAYLPELLFDTTVNPGYNHLAEQNYSHRPYVDGTPTIKDVFVNNAWRSYLVGTLNGGGKGVYVLDVTNPVAELSASTPTDIVVTEFTHANLGYTYARAQIAKLNNGRWAAIFGNGYNNTGSGEASLFILYLDDQNSDGVYEYLEISTGVGSVVNSNCMDVGSDCNGLSSTSVLDLSGNGIADRVYAGDLHGNMWAFDLSSTNSANWGIAHGASNDKPLFTACRNAFILNCAIADRQPITSKPVVVGHQSEVSRATSPNLMVLFGTGQYLTANDPSDTSSQSFYGVWDAGQNYGGLQRSNLVAQQITTKASTYSGNANTPVTVRSVNSSPVTYNEQAISGGSGWYMNLPTSGERSVLTPLINDDFISFVTSIPETGVCSGGGSGWLMAVNIFSGKEPSAEIFSDIADVAAGMPLANLSGGMITLEDKYIGADAIGDIIVINYKTVKKRPARRASWSSIR